MNLETIKEADSGRGKKKYKQKIREKGKQWDICPILTTKVGEGNGTPLQYSCLENRMDGGAWWTAAHGVAKSWTRLSDFTFTFHFHALEMRGVTRSHGCAGTGGPRGAIPH